MQSIHIVLLILLNLTIQVQVYKQPEGHDVRGEDITTAIRLFFENGVSASAEFDCDILNESRRYFIVDTDAGADDGVGIFSLLGAQDLYHDVAVITITAVNGNTNADNVGINVLKILKTAMRLDVPVLKGMNQSILFTPETDNFYGEDGFGDFEYPDPPSEDIIQDVHGVVALAELVKLCPGKFSLIALGPLTNIALAARLNPKFITDLDEILILGGSVEGVGNAKPGVEFNIFMDVDAAAVVLNEATKRVKPIVLVPWETAMIRAALPMDWRVNVLGAIDSPQIQILNQAEANQFNRSLWVSSDSLVTAVAIDRSLIKSSGSYHVDVETCGSFARGSLFVDYSGDVVDKGINVEIVKEIDTERFKEMLLRTLNPWGGEASGATRIA